MKCLSLWQPWATLIAIGAKQVETRSWRTRYRGPIAIHAAKVWTQQLETLCSLHSTINACLRSDDEIRRRMFGPPAEDRLQVARTLPLGCIVAVARLDMCLPTPRAAPDSGETFTVFDPRRLPDADPGTYAITPTECLLGDYAPGRYAWVLRDVRRLTTPIPCQGKQGLFAVSSEIERAIRLDTMPEAISGAKERA